MELLGLLTREAKEYRKQALKSIERNRHMNGLLLRNTASLKRIKSLLIQKIIDALLVDFINCIGAKQGIDYALHTERSVWFFYWKSLEYSVRWWRGQLHFPWQSLNFL